MKTVSLLVLIVLGLTGCGDLPAPFWGNPGTAARRLAQPLSPILAVPAPTDALLTDAASTDFAADLARSLQEAEVPALARAPRATDWRLLVRAESRANTIVPLFVVRDPAGEDQGSIEGAAVPLAAWSVAAPETMRSAAREASPRIVALLGGIRHAQDRADPNSLYNRPPKVMITDVKGAPGDGNIALTRQMRDHLAKFGAVVQFTPAGSDFSVIGSVTVAPVGNRQERVEIEWSVRNASGDERGRVIQLNEIPAGTLNRFWGDVAVVVAKEAAAGINDVLMRQSGREPGGTPNPGARGG